MADTWMPGWLARVDGEPARVLRGDFAHRVIPLEKPGHHTISMEYHPPGLLLGVAVSVLSVLLWAATCGLSAWRGYQPVSLQTGFQTNPFTSALALSDQPGQRRLSET
jgi:hypothetical protein